MKNISNKVCDAILFPRQCCTLQQTSSLTAASFCQLVCDRDAELYELNKDSAATISGLKSQLLSSNKAHAMLEKNHKKSKQKYQVEIDEAW